METCNICMRPMNINNVAVMNCTHLAHGSCLYRGKCLSCKLFSNRDEEETFDFDFDDEMLVDIPKRVNYHERVWTNNNSSKRTKSIIDLTTPVHVPPVLTTSTSTTRPMAHSPAQPQPQPQPQEPISMIIEDCDFKKIMKPKSPIKKQPRPVGSDFAMKYHQAMMQPPDKSNIDLVRAFVEKKKLEKEALMALRGGKADAMADERMSKYLEAHRKYKTLLKTNGFF